MATKPRKQRAENAARRHLQMVEATLRSVARNGLAATTLASVSQETGLSQGVAVFYFETKSKLLAAAFRHHYEVYRRNWRAGLEALPPEADAAARLAALIRADFGPVVFNREALSVWHAYWGESTARPIYAEISEEFDSQRADVLGEICAELLEGDAARGRAMAATIDALTDGFWLRAYLSTIWRGPEPYLALTVAALQRLLPEAAEALGREFADLDLDA